MTIGGGTVYATTALDVYQHDHIVGSHNVCGGVLCGHSTPIDRIPIFSHVGVLGNAKSFITNYSFALIEMPDGLSFTNVVLSGDNTTALKNNVAIFSACGSFVDDLCQPAVPTTQPVTTNYCPLAKSILLNQGTSISYTFVEVNGTITKDLTHFVYPDYCLPETGQNPYSPIVPTPVPEFGDVLFIVMVVAIVSGIAITSSQNRKFSPK